MEIVLALGAAASYGLSDFGGGVLTRRAHVLAVSLLSQLVSAVLLALAVLLWAGAYSPSGLGWGLAAGIAGIAGTVLLYQGLAIGRMSVVAPITAVLGAGLPVLFGLATGDRPGGAAITGIGLGLIAVVVITRSPEHGTAAQATDPRRALWCAIGSGVGFGLFFILLQRSPADSGLWPLMGTRISALVLLGILVAAQRVSLRPALAAGWWAAALGAGIALADLLFLLATRGGMLSLVAVVTSLYPAVTVTLASLFLHEKITRIQLAGLVAAGASVALIAAG